MNIGGRALRQAQGTALETTRSQRLNSDPLFYMNRIVFASPLSGLGAKKLKTVGIYADRFLGHNNNSNNESCTFHPVEGGRVLSRFPHMRSLLNIIATLCQPTT